MAQSRQNPSLDDENRGLDLGFVAPECAGTSDLSPSARKCACAAGAIAMTVIKPMSVAEGDQGIATAVSTQMGSL